MRSSTVSERALVLAPRGRDAAIAVSILEEAGLAGEPCASLPALLAELEVGAAFVLVTEEALATSDLAPLNAWLNEQEEWSDLPFVLLTTGGGGLERNPAARRYLEVLGNVNFLERPFHPTTLVSLARSALRGRRRQYEARARLEALREGEERYRTLFEAVDVGFCVLEMKFDAAERAVDYRLAEINPAFERQTGLRGVEGRWISEVAPGLEQYWFDTYGQVARTGEPVRFENRAEPLGRHYDVHAFRAGPPDQYRVGVLFNDISARIYAEERLRELNETLERQVAERTADRNALWQLSSDIMLRCTFDGVITAVNPAWTDVLGWREHELLGVNLFGFIHADDLTGTLAGAEELSRGMSHARLDGRVRCKDGGYRWISWSTRASEGLINAVGRDVTAEKERAAELELAQEALRQSQKLEAVGQLTGGVAHDFNNLLTIIKSSTDLLRVPSLTESRRLRYVDAISETVDRASKLTRQLLAFARRQALKPEVFDVGRRVQAIADMLRTVVGTRIAIVAELGTESCFVKADVSQFETALINMAVNARDAMDGVGTLTVAVACMAGLPPMRGHAGAAGPFIALTVADTGTGIPADQLPLIFEPFFTTKEVGKGTGLGLSQVYGFVKQSGGDVSVESEPGRGAVFTLYLPRVDSEAEEPPVDVPEAGGFAEGRGRRVLVVEDNIDVGRFSTQLLRDLGYETTWAATGGEALELLNGANRFDAVFSDVVMPGISGVELGKEIRRRHPDLPVVLTSGYSHVLAEEGRHGFELLHKPYAAEELSRVLRRVTKG